MLDILLALNLNVAQCKLIDQFDTLNGLQVCKYHCDGQTRPITIVGISTYVCKPEIREPFMIEVGKK